MFTSENEELIFYRSLLSKMNAVVYLINLDPYEIIWISENEMLQTVLGMDHEQVLKNGQFLAGKLVRDPDFYESVSTAVKAFYENSNLKWTGAYRIKKEGSTELSWVMYSTATFEKDNTGKPKTAIAVAFSLHDFNTPGAMKDFIAHLKSRIFTKERESLTQQQSLITSLILQNKSSNQIAQELSLSKYTIADHRKAIYKKLGCNNKAELYQVAQKLGL